MKRIIVVALLVTSLFFPVTKKTAMADAPVTQVLPDSRITALESYFQTHNCPLAPYAGEFVSAADKYNIDYRILPAISIHESTCGKQYPTQTNNPFGWQPFRLPNGKLSVLGFKSIPYAIDFITGQLANNPLYTNKTIQTKLSIYCPTPGYPNETMGYMEFFNVNQQN